MHDTANTPMPLLTPDQREQLLANGRQSGRDHVPVVKFFNPATVDRLAFIHVLRDHARMIGAPRKAGQVDVAAPR